MTTAANFGALLKRLRTERGMTQMGLAEAARISYQSIRRAEGSKQCVWKQSTALDVFTALNLRTWIPPEDADPYLEASGIARALADAQTRAKEPKATAAMNPNDLITNQDENAAHTWLAVLIRERGTSTVLTWLEALGATNGVQLPPRLPPNSALRGPQWAIYREIQYPDGWVVTERGPVQPPAAPAQGKPGDQQKKRAQRM